MERHEEALWIEKLATFSPPRGGFLEAHLEQTADLGALQCRDRANWNFGDND